MVAGAGSSTRAGSSTPDTSPAGYAEPQYFGSVPTPKSRAKARALALTQPPVVPGPGRHSRFEENPEETLTIDVEICLTERTVPDETRVQNLPDWAIIEDLEEEEEEEFDPVIVARYLRVVGNYIQIFELNQAWVIQGEYFAHVLERRRASQSWLELNGGDPRGGP